jgi:hypothetical protein
MSALGQKQTLGNVQPMSALHPKADIGERDWHVCFVPKADIASPSWWLQMRRLAGGFKLDVGNPIARSSAQAGLFILALES